MPRWGKGDVLPNYAPCGGVETSKGGLPGPIFGGENGKNV